MSLFSRVKNIIKSNINKNDKIDIDINSYEDIYYDDAKEIPNENSKEQEYYRILEVQYGASFDVIKKSYKKLLKKYHPDLYQNEPEKLEKAKKVTKKINEAYTYFERKNQ